MCRSYWTFWSLVKYVGGYHGLLSGVTVRPGSVEPHSVVECLYACREGLDFGDLETLGSGMKVRPHGTIVCHIIERELRFTCLIITSLL